MKSIKLLVSVYKDSSKPVGDFIVPVSAGAEKYKNENYGLLKDNSGMNISARNDSYCELTVMYWAWKNLECDVCGLMHQRRYFDFGGEKIYAYDRQNKLKKPYKIYDMPDSKTLAKIHADYESISKLTDRYELIAPLRENIFESVKSQYEENDGNGFDDMSLLCNIIGEKYPEYLPSAKKYLDGHFAYYCNMFIMQRRIFDDYCEWLFDILMEFEKRKPQRFKMPRECGKIGERLFGVYMTYVMDNTDIKWAEIPRTHFCKIGGATKNLSFNRTFYRLCPPGSRRRSISRKIKKKKKG